MHLCLHVEYPLFLPDFKQTWIFSTDFPKNTQISNVMKILPVGAEFFQADGQTEKRDQANNSFSQFSEHAT